ncbi:2-polyprenyl-6-methoxyphenol hydroxylase-like FAD-dependent oxidoreductase [Arcicella aurantiaca]|uniref:2-polyprenyl-6-methoxyphenol hydroxylase-like FAD-dependent oxidoreductase n=1 Tax=Arcicella aurantiaca TaxID=591202 RepID=A0A316DMU7_9BACT|nr:FAD-dependent monooxygenase [Arcicella aurantiaca]PWK18043.1 2-polyprenyl-6-methoxyphenol hydroxylase-like FAD-dependent oxidoreductase [Arcicella aurantiaca]
MAKKILIVGAGIGGQSAAIGLKKAGFEVDIIELHKEFNVYGVGIIQQANALRALDAIGVADEAMRRGSPYGKVKLCLPHGVQIGEAGTPPIGRFPSHNGISRRILHDVLFEEAQRIGLKYRMGVTVESIDNQPDAAHVTFTDGTKGSYDVVIAADGVSSKVRKLIFGDYKLNYVGLSVWRYAFKRPANLDTGYIFFNKKHKIGVIPMTADSCYIFLNSAEGDNPIIPEDQLVEKLKGYMSAYPVPLVQELIPQVTDPKLVNYRALETLKMPAPWYKNRVVVLGDAAHTTIPQLGSGAALAIEDAVVLIEELQKEGEVEEVFERYMKRRYERCKMVVDVSETLGTWELLEYNDQPLPEGANMGMLMGKTGMALTAEI